WDEYCPPASGPYPDYIVPANQKRILNTAGCYNSVTLNNRSQLELTVTSAPYFFKTLSVSGGHPQTQLQVNPSPADGTVQLYLLTLVTNNLNGNQTVNPTARPSQFRVNYLGTSDLTLNGNANFGMALTAPNAG